MRFTQCNTIQNTKTGLRMSAGLAVPVRHNGVHAYCRKATYGCVVQSLRVIHTPVSQPLVDLLGGDIILCSHSPAIAIGCLLSVFPSWIGTPLKSFTVWCSECSSLVFLVTLAPGSVEPSWPIWFFFLKFCFGRLVLLCLTLLDIIMLCEILWCRWFIRRQDRLRSVKQNEQQHWATYIVVVIVQYYSASCVIEISL